MLNNEKSTVDAAIANLKCAIFSELDTVERQEVGSSDWEEKWTRRIQEVQELPRLLRHLRNATLGVNRLPPELYGVIIAYMQPELMPYDQLLNAPPLKRGHGWIFATHICQRWRNAASPDNNKKLWSRIRINSESKHAVKAAVAFFHRSSPSLVEVVHEHSEHISPEQLSQLVSFYALLQTSPSRLGSLYLHGYWSTKHPAFQLVPGLCSRLAKVELYPARHWDDEEEPDVMGFLEDCILPCRTLQQLSTSLPRFPAKVPPLTHLYLYHTYISSFDEWLGFMAFIGACSTTLQVLGLYNSGAISEDVHAAISPVQARKNQVDLPSLLRVEIRDGHPDYTFLPFFCLRDLILPKRVTINWEYAKLNGIAYLYCEEPRNLIGTLPSSDKLSQIEKIVWISHVPGCFTLRYDTIYDDVKNIDIALPLLQASCPNIALMAMPSYDWTDLIWQDPYGQYPSLQFLHICWHTSTFGLLMSLEADARVLVTIRLKLPMQEYFQLSRIHLFGTVSIQFDDNPDDTSNLPFLPNLQSLVIYIGDVDIDHTLAPKYVFSRMLKNMGMDALKLTEDHEMVRHRKKLGKTFKLAFKKGGEERFETL